MDNILEAFGINDEYILNRKIFKKFFYEHDKLKKSQKNIIKDYVEEINLNAMLRPNIIKIPAYEDNTVQYLEIALIKVNLIKEGRERELAEIINKMIQYPIIMFLNYKDVTSIALCEKRLDKVTGDNNIIEDILLIKDIYNFKNFEEYVITIMYLNNMNLYEYYKELYRKTYALELTRDVDNYEAISKQPLDRLRESHRTLIEIEQNIISYRNKIMQEIDIGKRVDLNMKLKKEEKKRQNIFDKLKEIQNG